MLNFLSRNFTPTRLPAYFQNSRSFIKYTPSNHSRPLSTMRIMKSKPIKLELAVSTYENVEIKDCLHDFTLQSKEYVKEYSSLVAVYRHDKTGCQVYSVVNEDANKTFGVAFRTPVTNSKGIPHILEHSVLCGSDKYPSKEPFVELLRSSFNTFLNAFTCADRTIYPVASTNKKDMQNLREVYLDAVLNPVCRTDPLVMAQEGWHHHLEDEALAMFPESTYAHDAGGDPSDIPTLTYKEFVDFHDRLYHPSNAMIWFYGDDDPEERLKFLQGYLKKYDAVNVDAKIVLQRQFDSPRYVSGRYATTADDAKSLVSLNWVMGQQTFKTNEDLAMSVLDYLLLGTPASPLRKILNDSGLGESVIGGGFCNELKQPTFAVGLKGVAEDSVKEVEALILKTLKKHMSEGFSEMSVEAALNTIEFSLREDNCGSFPRGLNMMLRCVPAWVYGDDSPIMVLQWERDLQKLKTQIREDKNFWQNLLKKYLVENPHRVLVVSSPDLELQSKLNEKERKKLEAYESSLTQQQRQDLVSYTKALIEKQEAPDTNAHTVPSLTLSDITTEIEVVPTTLSKVQGVDLLHHKLFTNDIAYVDLLFDFSHIPMRLVPYVSLLTRCLTSMGTADQDLSVLTQHIDTHTGGVGFAPLVTSVRNETLPATHVFFSGKAVTAKLDKVFDIFTTLALEVQFDEQIFKQLVLEARSGMEDSVIESGHMFASVRLAAQKTLTSRLNEFMGGLEHLHFLRELTKKLDGNGWDEIKKDLEELRSLIFHRKPRLAHVTLDDEAAPVIQSHVAALIDRLDKVQSVNNVSNDDVAFTKELRLLPKKNEALFVPTQMQIYDKVADHLDTLTLSEESLTRAIIGTLGDLSEAHQLPDARGRAALLRHICHVSDDERRKTRREILNTNEQSLRSLAKLIRHASESSKASAVVTSQEFLETELPADFSSGTIVPYKGEPAVSEDSTSGSSKKGDGALFDVKYKVL